MLFLRQFASASASSTHLHCFYRPLLAPSSSSLAVRWGSSSSKDKKKSSSSDDWPPFASPPSSTSSKPRGKNRPPPPPELTKERAKAWVQSMSVAERQALFLVLAKQQEKEVRKKLQKEQHLQPAPPPIEAAPAATATEPTPAEDAATEEEGDAPAVEEVPRPTRAQLTQLAFHQSLPFIGFGFLDNLVMILAGEYIELTIGSRLAIGTMAAAALGNAVSDVFGIGSAWYVERLTTRLGAQPPPLTLEQLDLSVSRLACNVGRAGGVVFGCILGMFPLLF